MLTVQTLPSRLCRSYAERIGFYLQRIFTCEATGRQGLDYYSAMNSELKESASVHQRFPLALKPKVLASAHYCETTSHQQPVQPSLIDAPFDSYDWAAGHPC